MLLAVHLQVAKARRVKTDMTERGHFKDSGLDQLASSGYNIAQFVSYDDNGGQRYSRTAGNAANHLFASQADAAECMLTNTTGHAVNVRSYDPHEPESKPFVMELRTVDDILAVLRARKNEGLHTIMNEYVNECDGGVSGVVFGNAMEFAPDATPRIVERGGTANFTRAMGADILRKVYGVVASVSTNPNERTEFTITPLRTGVHNEHTLVWESRIMDGAPQTADTRWPNKFSTMLGDKTFGLLMADQVGLRVPYTHVTNRRVAPFSFGQPTGTGEYWMRTAPVEQTPGLYTTTRGWTDPYKIMQNEDPEGDKIASILSQEGIDAQYSGACVMGADGQLIINGKYGYGDDFMVGESGTDTIPPEVTKRIVANYQKASLALGGPVRFEWVYDGKELWTVQLHRGESASYGNVIFPGNTDTAYIRFATHDTSGHSRIDELRQLIAAHRPGTGIELVGDVGVTSHLGDILRKAAIPSFITSSKS